MRQSVGKRLAGAALSERRPKKHTMLVITPPGTEFATATEGSGFAVAKDPFAAPGTLEDINCATAHLEARLPHTLRLVEPLYAALYHLHRPLARVG